MKLKETTLVTNMNNRLVLSIRNDPNGSNIMIFNETGEWIIKQILLGKARDAIVDELVIQTGEHVSTVEEDVNKFIAALASANLIESE